MGRQLATVYIVLSEGAYVRPWDDESRGGIINVGTATASGAVLHTEGIEPRGWLDLDEDLFDRLLSVYPLAERIYISAQDGSPEPRTIKNVLVEDEEKVYETVQSLHGIVSPVKVGGIWAGTSWVPMV